jgi:hypothetical protein
LTGRTSSNSSSAPIPRPATVAAATAVAADTIRYLLELFPEAMTVRDCWGKTPYELATSHQDQEQQQHRTALSLFLLRRTSQQQAQSVAMTRIELELTTAMWKLLPTYRAVVRKQHGNGTRRHARMRFVV